MRPVVVGRVHMVGDAEHVEPLLAVQVDHLRYRKSAVAPRRMRVELGKEEIR